MCGRYRLNRGWERDLQGMLRFVNEKLDIDEERVDVRPTDPLPVIRSVA
jgi:putative SOS response-associated peptidase YedK